MANLTEAQSKLWHVTEKEMEKIGANHPGGAAAEMNQNPILRAEGKIEGTKIWAIKKVMAAARTQMPGDEECIKLLSIISPEIC